MLRKINLKMPVAQYGLTNFIAVLFAMRFKNIHLQLTTDQLMNLHAHHDAVQWYHNYFYKVSTTYIIYIAGTLFTRIFLKIWLFMYLRNLTYNSTKLWLITTAKSAASNPDQWVNKVDGFNIFYNFNFIVSIICFTLSF